MTAAAVVLPKAMAHATVAGLPGAVGLYTAFVPILIYALLLTAALRRMPEVSCWALAGSLPSQVAGVWSGMAAWGKVMAAEIQLREYPPAPAASPPAVRWVVAAARTNRMPDARAGQGF